MAAAAKTAAMATPIAKVEAVMAKRDFKGSLRGEGFYGAVHKESTESRRAERSLKSVRL